MESKKVLIRAFNIFFQWQGKFFLGERVFYAQSKHSKNHILNCIKKEIGVQDPKGKRITCSNENENLTIEIKPLLSENPVYLFKVKIVDENGWRSVFGEYKMKLFSKTYNLIWLNSIIFLLIIFAFNWFLNLYHWVIGKEELDLFGNSIPILAGTTALAFGFFMTRIIQTLHSPRILLSLINCFFDQ